MWKQVADSAEPAEGWKSHLQLWNSVASVVYWCGYPPQPIKKKKKVPFLTRVTYSSTGSGFLNIFFKLKMPPLHSSCHSWDPDFRLPSVWQHRHRRLVPPGARRQDRSLHIRASAHEPRGPAAHQRGLPLDGGGGDPRDGAHAHRWEEGRRDGWVVSKLIDSWSVSVPKVCASKPGTWRSEWKRATRRWRESSPSRWR